MIKKGDFYNDLKRHKKGICLDSLYSVVPLLCRLHDDWTNLLNSFYV